MKRLSARPSSLSIVSVGLDRSVSEATQHQTLFIAPRKKILRTAFERFGK
jgi:hypothetical protein